MLLSQPKMLLGQLPLYQQGKPWVPTGTQQTFTSLHRIQLPPTLVMVYQKFLKGSPYLPSGYQAHIKLIPKKGKDPSGPGSYCPISLLNLDSKLLSKIMANRLALIIIPSLIHPSQAGFTQGRSATSNIRKILAVLELSWR